MADAAPTPTAETPPPAPTLHDKLTTALTEQAPVITPEVTAEVVETPTASKRLAELGFENVKDEEAFDRLLAAYTQQKNEFGSKFEALFEEVRSLKAPEPVVETKGQPTSEWNWSPPQVDLQLAAKYKTADGWKPETPADLRQAFEARETFEARFVREFMNDPEAALGKLIDKRAKDIVQQTFGQVQTEQQQHSAYSQLISGNAWIYENDPITGKPSNKLSVQGQRVNDLTAEILARPYAQHMSQAEVLELALERFEAEKSRSATTRQTQTQTAQEQAAQRKQEVVQRAAPGLPTRNGSTGTPNRNLTPGQRFVQNARSNGDTLVS
jgi:hypothetical protein